MFGTPPAARSRTLALPALAVLFAAACADTGSRELVSPEALSEDVLLESSSGFIGTGKLTVTVLKHDGTPAENSLVVVVYPPPPGESESNFWQYGPIRSQLTDAAGVALWTDLPKGASVCVHARSGVSGNLLDVSPLYPAPIGAIEEFAEAEGDGDQAPVLTGERGRGIPFTAEDYVKYCVKEPPVTITGGTKVTLQHGEAGRVDAVVLDLLGERADVQRGIITQVGTCSDIPWLQENECSDKDGIFPGFLHSNTASSRALSYAKGLGHYRIEALSSIEVGDQPVDLVGTLGFTSDPPTTEELTGEQLVCTVTRVDDAQGDAASLDIHWYKWSIGVLYGAEVTLESNPAETIVWWEMTPGVGSVSYTSRTVYETSPATVQNSVNFSLSAAGDGYTCSNPPPGGNPNITASVFCYLTEEGMIRVTLIERDSGPEWSTKEFNVKTNPATGAGDSTEDPSRSVASRAYTAFDRDSKCTIPSGNDDRFGLRL